MALSLTCSCGAHLEIDDKFAGQTIYCPDCHKQIETRPPPPKLPTTSTLAVSSLALALVSGLTIIGPMIAAGLGWFALRKIDSSEGHLAGASFARAGVILGVLLAVLGVGALLSPYVGGVDALFREMEWASKLDFPTQFELDHRIDKGFSITRASPSWGVFRHLQGAAADGTDNYDNLILVNPREDAYLSCMSVELDVFRNREDAESHRDQALQRFLTSELVHLMGKFKGKLPKLNPAIITEKKIESQKDASIQEILLDLKLGGFPRTFLLRIVRLEKNQFHVNIVAAGTRSHNFKSLEPEFREMLESFKTER